MSTHGESKVCICVMFHICNFKIAVDLLCVSQSVYMNMHNKIPLRHLHVCMNVVELYYFLCVNLDTYTSAGIYDIKPT